MSRPVVLSLAIHLVDLSAYPQGTRMIVRRERPHPGAELSVFDTMEGLRHQVFITDTPRRVCSVRLLELRHRAHARVEDRVRCGKDIGFGRFVSRQFNINTAWRGLAQVGVDLLALTRILLLGGEHTLAEPKKLRNRLLRVARPLVRTARRVYLRIAEYRPWAIELPPRTPASPPCPDQPVERSHGPARRRKSA